MNQANPTPDAPTTIDMQILVDYIASRLQHTITLHADAGLLAPVIISLPSLQEIERQLIRNVACASSDWTAKCSISSLVRDKIASLPKGGNLEGTRSIRELKSVLDESKRGMLTLRQLVSERMEYLANPPSLVTASLVDVPRLRELLGERWRCLDNWISIIGQVEKFAEELCEERRNIIRVAQRDAGFRLFIWLIVLGIFGLGALYVRETAPQLSLRPAGLLGLYLIVEPLLLIRKIFKSRIG